LLNSILCACVRACVYVLLLMSVVLKRNGGVLGFSPIVIIVHRYPSVTPCNPSFPVRSSIPSFLPPSLLNAPPNNNVCVVTDSIAKMEGKKEKERKKKEKKKRKETCSGVTFAALPPAHPVNVVLSAVLATVVVAVGRLGGKRGC